jgi:hypothetical protein
MSHEISMGGSNIVVLLTATIDPRNMVKLVRREPQQRLDDYRNALQNCWLSNELIADLVFCENSNADLTDIHKLFAVRPLTCGRAESMSFDGQQFPRHLGKGFGEIGIISYALRHSKLLREDNPLVIKVSGRLEVVNFGKLVKLTMAHPDFDISCDFRGNLQWADSRVFISRADFLRNYLVPMQSLLDESRGITFEHILGRATHRGIADGVRWRPMQCTPDIRGVSGTTNIRYPSSLTSWLRRDGFRRLKNWTLAR